MTTGKVWSWVAGRGAAALLILCLPILGSLARASTPIPRPTTEPALELEMLLEKTIFQVDVLTLELWLGAATARQAAPFLAAEPKPSARDSIARIATESRDAWARITFLRDVGLSSFLGGIIENIGRAQGAGLLTEAEGALIVHGLPQWFSPLQERGIKDGDRIFYRIRGDTLRTLFFTVEGQTPVDQTDVGPERRLSVLGSFFVRGSDFRSKLLKSLDDMRPR